MWISGFGAKIRSTHGVLLGEVYPRVDALWPWASRAMFFTKTGNRSEHVDLVFIPLNRFIYLFGNLHVPLFQEGLEILRV